MEQNILKYIPLRKIVYHLFPCLVVFLLFLSSCVSGTLGSPLLDETQKNGKVHRKNRSESTENLLISVPRQNEQFTFSKISSSRISQLYDPHAPIDINGNTDFLTHAVSEGWSGTGTPIDPILIENYEILSNMRTSPTVRIQNTDLYFQIRNNLFRPTYSAIGLSNVTNAQIINNNISSCQYGVNIDRSHHNTVSKNIIQNQEASPRVNAINIYDSNFTTIANNTVHGEYGIVRRAILLNGSINNIISNNYISNCENAIYSNYSRNNIFLYNQIQSCIRGVYFKHTSNETLIHNTIKWSGYSDWNEYKYAIEVYSGNMTILNNSLVYNERALHFNEPDEETPNKIVVKWNDFIGNDIQAIDNGTNNSFDYNYWDDWTAPDSNGDGIVDNPYPIEGKANNHDFYPLTTPNDPSAHFLSRVRFIHPSYEEKTLSGIVTLEWEAKDTQEHNLSYSIYYRTYDERRNTTWHFLADLSETSYQWDTTNVPNVEPGYILILRVTCSAGLTLDHHSHVFKVESRDSYSYFPIIIEITLIVVIGSAIGLGALVLIYSRFQKWYQKKNLQ